MSIEKNHTSNKKVNKSNKQLTKAKLLKNLNQPKIFPK